MREGGRYVECWNNSLLKLTPGVDRRTAELLAEPPRVSGTGQSTPTPQQGNPTPPSGTPGDPRQTNPIDTGPINPAGSGQTTPVAAPRTLSKLSKKSKAKE